MDAYQEICAKNSAYDIKRIDDPSFKQYGTLWNEFDLTELEAFCNKNVKIDSEKNFYVPSNPALEKLALIQQVSNEVYAGMPLEAGECTGQTRDFTAVEYHQGSEVNVALTDVVMVLAHRAILEKKGSIDPKEDAKLFFVPAGTVFEMYSDTLHYSPIKVHASGFKVIVILPEGSNQPLPEKFSAKNKRIVKKNKFQLVHACRKDKIEAGAEIGVTGDLIEIEQIEG